MSSADVVLPEDSTPSAGAGSPARGRSRRARAGEALATAGGALAELAERHGVVTSFTAVDGSDRVASPEALVAVLSALGVPIGHPEAAADVLESENAEAARGSDNRDVPPVFVHWVGREKVQSPVLAPWVADEQAWVTLELEDGTTRHSRGSVGALFADELPAGYHRVRIERPRRDGPGTRSAQEVSALVIAAPRCPEPDRGWGGFLPLYALRTATDRGVGTYTDLAAFGAFIGELGGSLVGTLPLFPGRYDEIPVDPSPYLPLSRVAWNELYIDPMTLPELETSLDARRLVAGPEMVSRVAGARWADSVDYASVASNTRSILEILARDLYQDGATPRRIELERFLEMRPEIAAYAAFRAGGDEDARQYFCYAQWVAESQVADAGSRTGGRAGLYLDLPIGVSGDGFDPAFWPESFAARATGGAPPDGFFGAGQNWGFPPLHPSGLRHDEYRYLRTVLRHLFAHATAVRIDHVMGLHRLYWVPDGFEASEGAYVRYPAEELRAVVALEAARAGVAVVGEDLGTVPDEVRASMSDDRVLRSHVVQFDAGSEDPLPQAPALSMASMGTHDLPTFATFYEGGDIDERERNGELGAVEAAAARRDRLEWREALASACGETDPPVGDAVSAAAALVCSLRHLAGGQARLMMVDLEDLWLERVPQNRPGTGPQAMNWSRRAARSLEEMRGDESIAALAREIDKLRRGRP